MIKLTEKNLEFEFNLENVIKFDETIFYNKKFDNLPNAKAVDFIGYDKNKIVIIEVKDFSGYEAENKNRLLIRKEDSLHTEVALKVRETLACLLSAGTFEDDNDLKPFIEKITKKINSKDIEIKIILFLEGEISKKDLQSIKKKKKNDLRWLNGHVLVENTQQIRYRDIYQAVSKI